MKTTILSKTQLFCVINCTLIKIVNMSTYRTLTVLKLLSYYRKKQIFNRIMISDTKAILID